MSDEIRKWAADALKLEGQPFAPPLAPYQRKLLELLLRGEKIDFRKIAFARAPAWKTHINKLIMMAEARAGRAVFQARLEDGKVVLDEITSGMPYDEI